MRISTIYLDMNKQSNIYDMNYKKFLKKAKNWYLLDKGSDSDSDGGDSDIGDPELGEVEVEMTRKKTTMGTYWTLNLKRKGMLFVYTCCMFKHCFLVFTLFFVRGRAKCDPRRAKIAIDSFTRTNSIYFSDSD